MTSKAGTINPTSSTNSSTGEIKDANTQQRAANIKMAVDTREELLFIFIVLLKVRRAAGPAEPKGLTRRTVRRKEHRKLNILYS